MAQDNPDDDYLRVMNSIRLQEAADLCERPASCARARPSCSTIAGGRGAAR